MTDTPCVCEVMVPGALFTGDDAVTRELMVQRCETCGRYDTDLAAAMAVAGHLGGALVAVKVDADGNLVEGTDPYVVVDRALEDAVIMPFRDALDLHMVSDPSPLPEEQDARLEVALDRRARELGFDGWVDAYHRFAKKEAGEPQATTR